jgi:hypothetical protein
MVRVSESRGKIEDCVEDYHITKNKRFAGKMVVRICGSVESVHDRSFVDEGFRNRSTDAACGTKHCDFLS